MTDKESIALWQQRRESTRRALSGLSVAMDNMIFAEFQAPLKQMYRKLNDYVLTCYEKIAELGGDPYK